MPYLSLAPNTFSRLWVLLFELKTFHYNKCHFQQPSTKIGPYPGRCGRPEDVVLQYLLRNEHVCTWSPDTQREWHNMGPFKSWQGRHTRRQVAASVSSAKKKILACVRQQNTGERAREAPVMLATMDF